MRKFKHKKLGWETYKDSKDNDCYFIDRKDKSKNDTTCIPCELIENSSDWEEVIEKDRIDEVIEHVKVSTNYEYTDQLRRIIEKHAPKQGLHESEVKRWFRKDKILYLQDILDFLAEYGLLLSDE